MSTDPLLLENKALNGLCISFQITAHKATNIQGVSGGIVNILGGGSMDYSE
jgi:hypothetical protein